MPYGNAMTRKFKSVVGSPPRGDPVVGGQDRRLQSQPAVSLAVSVPLPHWSGCALRPAPWETLHSNAPPTNTVTRFKIASVTLEVWSMVQAGQWHWPVCGILGLLQNPYLNTQSLAKTTHTTGQQTTADGLNPDTTCVRMAAH